MNGLKEDTAYLMSSGKKKEWQSQTCLAAWTSILTGIGTIVAVGFGVDIISPDTQEAALEYIVPITMVITGLWARWGRKRASRGVE